MQGAGEWVRSIDGQERHRRVPRVEEDLRSSEEGALRDRNNMYVFCVPLDSARGHVFRNDTADVGAACSLGSARQCTAFGSPPSTQNDTVPPPVTTNGWDSDLNRGLAACDTATAVPGFNCNSSREATNSMLRTRAASKGVKCSPPCGAYSSAHWPRSSGSFRVVLSGRRSDSSVYAVQLVRPNKCMYTTSTRVTLVNSETHRATQPLQLHHAQIWRGRRR